MTDGQDVKTDSEKLAKDYATFFGFATNRSLTLI
jgi:hypothetical protein